MDFWVNISGKSQEWVRQHLSVSLVLLLSLPGCIHLPGERVACPPNAVLVLAAGRLLDYDVPPDSCGKAAYAIESILAGAVGWTNRTGCVIVELYTRTCGEGLPTNALLVMVSGEDVDCSYLQTTYKNLIPKPLRSAPFLKLELVGRDVSRSLLPDTASNRRQLTNAIATGQIYLQRDQWLAKTDAIRAALAALGLLERPHAREDTSAKRYAFGWVVEWLPRSWGGIGAPARVVVRDDGTVVYVSYAIY